MTTVLVTGGAGYIGSHTAKALSRAGATPVVVDNLSRGHEDAVKWGPFENADILDTDALRAVLARHKPVAVIHFAAFAYVGESVADPYLYYRNNVAGTVSLLEAMRSAACDKIVFSSTCATYGVPERTPIDETAPQTPVNPYGASKLMVERILRDAEAAYDLKSVALRYFNAAGADPDGDLGERHDPETHLIPLVLRAARGEGFTLSVFGDDYETPDGSCVRDYIHVSDLADAHVLSLDNLLSGGASAAFNLGNERGYSVFDVIKCAEKVTGKSVPYTVSPRRPGDPPALVASAVRARETLGWAPKRGDLAVQIEDAWRWFSGRNAPST